MTNSDRLETRRLCLYAPELGDAESIAKLANNWNIAKNLGTLPYPYTKIDAQDWITKQQNERGRGKILPTRILKLEYMDWKRIRAL